MGHSVYSGYALVAFYLLHEALNSKNKLAFILLQVRLDLS